MTTVATIERPQETLRAMSAPVDAPARPELSVIIVNWNAGAHLEACLASLETHLDLTRTEIIVVDNDSDDGMAERIEARRPEVRVMRLEANLGFAAANNRALRLARGRYLLLLNPDTEINATTLPAAVRFVEANPEVGVVGVRAFRPDGTQQSTMFRLPRLRDVAVNVIVPNRLMRRSSRLGAARYADLDPDEPRDVEAVAGCFMLIRREVFGQVGGLDESFFMYGEEAEWCHRIARAGWRIVYRPEASILHHGGVCTEQCPDEMNLALARSQLRLFRRTRGPVTTAFAATLMLARDVPRAFAWHILRWTPFAKSRRLIALRRSAERCGPIARACFEGKRPS